MADPSEVGASLPAPPAFYTRYTANNLRLLSLVQSGGTEALEGQEDVPTDFDVPELEKPRADWIVEEGGYGTYGEYFPIPTRVRTLIEEELLQLYPSDARDRRPALRSLLRTLLHTYHGLLTMLLGAPPPIDSGVPQAGVFEYTEWIKLAAINMTHSINGLRGMQARGMMEGLMSSQLEGRRRRVEEIKAKCDNLTDTLAKLREKAAKLAAARRQAAPPPPPRSVPADDIDMDTPDVLQRPAGSTSIARSSPAEASMDDVARWVDEVG